MNNLFAYSNVLYIFNLSFLWYIFSFVSSFINILSDGSLLWDIFSDDSLNRNFFNIWNLLRNVINNSFIRNLRNIFSLMFDCIVISVFFLNWNIFNLLNCFIISIFSLKRNLFKSCFSFD